MKWSIVLLIVSCHCLGAQLLINTFDMSAYLFTDGERLQFKAHCPVDMRLMDEIVDLYEPVNLTVRYIPMPDVPLLISQQGFTIATKMADIVIPEEMFVRLSEMVKSNQKVTLVVDRYPIEIYPDRIRVVEPVGKEKIEFFLSHFFEKVPKVLGIGEHKLQKVSTYQLVVSCFPGLGGILMAIFEDEPSDLTFIEAERQTKGLCIALPPGEHTVEIVSSSDATQLTLNLPDWTVRLESEEVELGTTREETLFFPSGLQPDERFLYPGRYVALQFHDGGLIVRDLRVKDTLPPKLTMSVRWLDSMCQIQLDGEDFSPFETFFYVDGEKLNMQRGVLRLSSEKHILIGVARDTFENVAYTIKILERPAEMLVFSQEKVINVGGFRFSSPYLKWQVFDASSIEVKVNERTFRIEKDR